MLSYQHIYHAGNAADVHKHVLAGLLLDHLRKKNKPFCVIDVHAGEGLYDLAAPEALKNAEFSAGIAKLWNSADRPPAVEALLARVRTLNPEGKLERYPGSPALALAAMRTDDRLILNELHPGAYRALRRWAGSDERISLHKRDALEALAALTPPAIRRGLALVDPSYEIKTDYARVPEVVARAAAKWPEGIFAVWYPVLEENRHDSLRAAFKAGFESNVLAVEINFGRDVKSGLRGAGLVIVNPPWKYDEEAGAVGDWLAHIFAQGRGAKHTVTWLCPPAD